MRKTVIIAVISFATFLIPALSPAIETAPRITDREIIESLTDIRGDIKEVRGDIKRLEEGQKAVIRELDKRFEAVDKQFDRIDSQFDRIDSQFDRIDSQFNRLSAIFTALVVSIIGFAIWDRRTMIRPFETKVRDIEEQIAENRTKLHSLIESLRSLSKTDNNVAEILKKFNLL